MKAFFWLKTKKVFFCRFFGIKNMLDLSRHLLMFDMWHIHELPGLGTESCWHCLYCLCLGRNLGVQVSESSDRLKRERWMDQKAKKIKDQTVRSLESEVQKIMNR